MTSRALAALIAVGGLTLCSTMACARHKQPLDLPCGMTGFALHMSEDELKALRPNAWWSKSTGYYHEQDIDCKPFVDSATYVIGRWSGLVEVHLTREWYVSTLAEWEATIPGFLRGCRDLWGMPEGTEVFTLPRMKGRPDYWRVGLWWRPAWGDVYAFYSSPRGLMPYGNQWFAMFDVTISEHGATSSFETFRRWTTGDTNPEMVAKHFRGFPTDTEVAGPIFH